jgi:hypothetical protein
MWKFGQHFRAREIIERALIIHPGPSFSFALDLWYARTISDFEECHIFIHPE